MYLTARICVDEVNWAAVEKHGKIPNEADNFTVLTLRAEPLLTLVLADRRRKKCTKHMYRKKRLCLQGARSFTCI